MGDIKLFRIHNFEASEIIGTAVALEKSLQNLIEKNLERLLGVRFLVSEYSTGPKHGGRIDTLGIDENGSPVIIEYKRSMNENVINQGLFYLDWLMDHKAEFKLMVLDKFGKDSADVIEWSSPRLVCIAEGFTKYDEYAVQQMKRNIELIRYHKFGEDLLLFELVNAVSIDSQPDNKVATKASAVYKTITETLVVLKPPLSDLYYELEAFLTALADDVQKKVLKYYVAFKRIKNFACIEIYTQKNCIVAYLKIDPSSIELKPGFTRDVRHIGHYGTGDLEVTIRNRDDLELARPLFLKSYEVS